MACTILIGCILNLLFIVSLCCSHQDPEQLFQACEQGDLEVVHRFLTTGTDVDIRDTVRLELILLCVVSAWSDCRYKLHYCWCGAPCLRKWDLSNSVCVCVSYGVTQRMCSSVHDALQKYVQVTSSTW